MKKAQKSALIQQLGMCLTDNKESIYQDQSLKSGVVIDVMAIIRKIKRQGLENLEIFAIFAIV